MNIYVTYSGDTMIRYSNEIYIYTHILATKPLLNQVNKDASRPKRHIQVKTIESTLFTGKVRTLNKMSLFFQ